MTIKHWLEERGIHWHWQNLSDEPGKERHGAWYGRAWLHFSDRRALNVEWHHGRVGAAVSLRFDSTDREVQVHVAGPGFSYFLSYEGLPAWVFKSLPMKFGHSSYGYEREIGVRINDGSIWWSLWADPMCWNSRDPKWMSGSFDVVKFLLGDTAYNRRVIEERDVLIPMPERTYPAKAKLEVATWIRPRWPWSPFSQYGTYVQVDVPGGIGIPGKGENSWDCGDDALFGMSTKASTIEEGIGHVVASALRTRRKYGWSPLREVTP